MSAATRSVRVVKISREALDVLSFELADAEGRALPPFSAGSHIDVHLPEGLVRQYSLCNDPAQTHRYLIAVLREPASRGGSAGMHALQEGTVLQISEPRNHFALAPEAGHHVLVAGGIGVTPLLSMAQRLASVGASFDLHYCARSAQRAAFVERIRQSAFSERVQFHWDDGAPGQKLDIPAIVEAAAVQTHLYVCGPAGFMDWVLAAASAEGWSAERLHREYFTAATADRSEDGSFEVQLASTGLVIRVAADQTVAQALQGSGVHLATSCEQGVCGTCLTRVVEGIPDHRDLFLTPAEQELGDQFLPCCSRSKSPRLVLDL